MSADFIRLMLELNAALNDLQAAIQEAQWNNSLIVLRNAKRLLNEAMTASGKAEPFAVKPKNRKTKR